MSSACTLSSPNWNRSRRARPLAPIRRGWILVAQPPRFESCGLHFYMCTCIATLLEAVASRCSGRGVADTAASIAAKPCARRRKRRRRRDPRHGGRRRRSVQPYPHQCRPAAARMVRLMWWLILPHLADHQRSRHLQHGHHRAHDDTRSDRIVTGVAADSAPPPQLLQPRRGRPLDLKLESSEERAHDAQAGRSAARGQTRHLGCIDRGLVGQGCCLEKAASEVSHGDTATPGARRRRSGGRTSDRPHPHHQLSCRPQGAAPPCGPSLDDEAMWWRMRHSNRTDFNGQPSRPARSSSTPTSGRGGDRDDIDGTHTVRRRLAV